MNLDKFDATLARADRVMARVDERQGASGDARLRERNRKLGGYGRAFTKATIAAVAIVIGALALGLLNPIGIIGFVVAVGIAIAAFGLIFFGGVASTATAPKIPTDASNGEMVDKFDSYMFRARRGLPAAAQTEIDRIGNALPPLRESLARLGDTVPEAQDARRLLSIHLPGLIDRYLHVPAAYRTVTPLGPVIVPVAAFATLPPFRNTPLWTVPFSRPAFATVPAAAAIAIPQTPEMVPV